MTGKPQTLITKNVLGSKLILGGVTVAVSAIVGTAGIAAAHGLGGSDSNMPVNVAQCKTDYKKFGYKNVGQCVSDFARHHGGMGYGYGGQGHHKHHHHHFFSFFANWWHHFFRHHHK